MSDKEEFLLFITESCEKQKELIIKKQKQYATEDALADFRTYALARFKDDSWETLYEVAKGFMGKHIAHIINHDINGDKIDESLHDISAYCNIMCYFIQKNKTQKTEK